jgi:hypothetical protein
MVIDPHIAAGRSSYLLVSVFRVQSLLEIWKVAGQQKNTMTNRMTV